MFVQCRVGDDRLQAGFVEGCQRNEVPPKKVNIDSLISRHSTLTTSSQADKVRMYIEEASEVVNAHVKVHQSSMIKAQEQEAAV